MCFFLLFLKDWESDPPTISYSKNGEDLGVCFEIDREEIGEAPLFAHILTKNTEFECNFGQNVCIFFFFPLFFLV